MQGFRVELDGVAAVLEVNRPFSQLFDLADSLEERLC